ncbi:MAG: hypothetical protein ACKVOU_07940 [Cytophagales bacterium]
MPKITIKPFVNKNLTPLEASSKYPLYFQITFQRRNTQVKSHFNTFLETVEGIRGDEFDILKFEMEILEKTVFHEYKKAGKAFTLHGIKEKYELNILSLTDVFEGHLKKKLLKAIKYCHSEFLPIIKFDGFEVTFTLLFKASKLLIDNFTKTLPSDFKEEIEAYQNFVLINKTKLKSCEYACVIDWQQFEYQTELKNSFAKIFPEKIALGEKNIAILNGIVEERLKFL